MNNRKNIIPNNLKEHRIRCGYTQKEVAMLLGMKCEDRLSHWEKGKNMPSVMNLFKLCEIYGVEPYSMYKKTKI